MYTTTRLVQLFKPRQNLLPNINPTLQNIFSSSSTNYSSQPNSNSLKTNTHDSLIIQDILKHHLNSSAFHLEKALDRTAPPLDEALILQVLKWHHSEWKSAYHFFNWVSKRGYHSPGVYNQMLDIFGRMKRFTELRQVFDEMSHREGFVSETTFEILARRYAAAHKVDEAIGVFNKRREFGFELDLPAFQTLLLALCRYKHVEVAESLFLSKQNEFPIDIKTLNIVLNGWCVLGNLREAKRFWKDILSSMCRPDKFTYGIFIKALTKAGKLGSAVKLFRSMSSRMNCDVPICNCVIDALCFKKRIPEALEIFEGMKEGRYCLPDVATYNSLIKHLCKIARMEKVYNLLEEMEGKKGCCTPNATTFIQLLQYVKKPEEVDVLLERMRRNGCQMTGDAYNVILKLFLDWNHVDKVQSVWLEMEKNGVGPDPRSYTIMIHSLHKKTRIVEALKCFNEMMSKGMIPEPKTNLLVEEMKMKLKESENDRPVQEVSDDCILRGSVRYRNKNRLR